MKRRPSDCWSEPLLAEFRRLAALPGLPVELRPIPGDERSFTCKFSHDTFLRRFVGTGQDFAGLVPPVLWLRQGPKIVNVTEEQYAALSRVEVRLRLEDVRLPYPTVLVNMPPGKMHEYVMVCKLESGETADGRELMIAHLASDDHTRDIVTVVPQTKDEVEVSLAKYTHEVDEEEGRSSTESLRVATNMLLAMTNFGCSAQYLFPKEVARERKYVAKGDRAGRSGVTASQRLVEQPMLLTLDRTVRLWHSEGGDRSVGHTGRAVASHWRRGHWRKARVGEGRSQTRLVFVRPCLVRADLATAAPADTTTTYE